MILYRQKLYNARGSIAKAVTGQGYVELYNRTQDYERPKKVAKSLVDKKGKLDKEDKKELLKFLLGGTYR